MESSLRFSRHFDHRMRIIAIITGLFIAVSMPATYLGLTLDREWHEAAMHSEELSWDLQKAIKENPRLWKYNLPKFTEIFLTYQLEGLSQIKIYDEKMGVVYQETLSKPSILHIRSRVPIVYNNHLFGYAEVVRKSDGILSIFLVLVVVFALLGAAVGVALYKFPTRIVRQAEHEVAAAFQQLDRLSRFDALTNLPNRLQLNASLGKLLERAKENRQKLGVMFLDLDRFKLINDTLGHTNGDLMLQMVADRLSQCIRNDDVVARLGGDEFIIVIPEVANVQTAASMAQRITETLAQPANLGGYELWITCSIGIAIFPDDGEDMETLIKNADTAMYRAKEMGKNRYQFYLPDMNAVAVERLTLENSLRGAIKKQELVIHYQPIVNLSTMKIAGVEALVRWNHPHLGLIPPDKFIPLAEETGLIIPLGEWVLRHACLQNKRWQEAVLSNFFVSVNLSVRQFQQPNLVAVLGQVLRETGLDPRYLQLEITESIAMYNEEMVISKLHALQHLGVHIAIDDFGTGYSALDGLKKFPIHCLKIDRSFIRNLGVNPFDATITSSVIALAHALNLRVVAEGVETPEQRSFLLDRECDEMQGYLFSKPIPALELEKLIKKRKLPPEQMP